MATRSPSLMSPPATSVIAPSDKPGRTATGVSRPPSTFQRVARAPAFALAPPAGWRGGSAETPSGRNRSALDGATNTSARSATVAVTLAVALELQERPAEEWTSLLARYSGEHGVTFYLANQRGEVMAGPGTALPRKVMVRLRAFQGFPRPPGAELYAAFFPRPFSH